MEQASPNPAKSLKPSKSVEVIRGYSTLAIEFH
jgi:hypothetical protein